ncbi:MAG: phage tail sheath subtilisin-like domain-containing protein [Patulibacter minatonensis]
MPFGQPTHTPGVFINEVASKSRPISGVATSVAAFVGITPGGPLDTPIKVTSWMEFERTFGSDEGVFLPEVHLSHSVQGFFQNGGSTAWIVRVGAPSFADRPFAVLPSVAGDQVPAPFTLVLRDDVSLTSTPPAKGKKGDDEAADATPVARAFSATLTATTDAGHASVYTLELTDGTVTETIEGLTLTPGQRSIVNAVNAESKLVRVLASGAALQSSEAVPKAGEYGLLAVPAADARPTPDQFIGNPAYLTGLSALSVVDEVTMVCVPDLMVVTADPDEIKAVQDAVVEFCEAGRRMAILDPPPSRNNQEMEAWRSAHVTASEFSTLYWPWIEVLDPASKHIIAVPPSGHIAGAWAGNDSARGVHKAPANVTLGGAIGPAFTVNDAGQGALNDAGVNCIRAFPGQGTLIWGARTLSSDPEWTYLNVRRLFNYLMGSILNATSWAVFEPNDETLWGALEISVSNFLTATWRSGALFGSSPDEAFFVKCDAETNPPELRDLGQVNIQIGVAPVKPAEFVVFEISQYQPSA